MGRAVKRVLVGTALIAQCFALVAPLADVHTVTLPSLGALLTPSGAPAVEAPHPNPVHHDALTCVACIAQSLVALRSATPVAAPMSDGVAELGEVGRVSSRSNAPGTPYHPRGPPSSH